jgi:hypothetical protein
MTTICLGRQSLVGSGGTSVKDGSGLALGKDLAVSFPLFAPYGGTRPSSLGSGLSDSFGSERFCSHLYITDDSR